MALDEATTALLGQLAEAGGAPMHELSPDEARARMAGLAAMFPAGPDLARAEDVVIPGPGGDLPARVLAPADPRGVLLYWHGGGWVVGSIAENEAFGRRLAVRTGCTVVLASYRLAPEHPWPAAVEDAQAALTWVAAHRAGLAGPQVPLVLAGDSAGANLATVVCRRARDEDGAQVALQILVYPVTDHDFENRSYTEPDNQLALNAHTLRWFWDHYVRESDRGHPDVSPAHADDLSRLPPALVLTAEHDVLRDEGAAYAGRLRAAGVPVEHHDFAGQMHGFFTMAGLLPGHDDALEVVAERLDRLFTPARRATEAP